MFASRFTISALHGSILLERISMKKSLIISVIAVFAFVLTLAPMSVFARDGAESSDTTTNTNDDSSGSGSASTDNGSDSSTRRQEIELKIEQAKEQAKEKLDAAKTEVKDKLSSDRLKICENRTTRVNQLLQDNSTRAKSALTKFEAVATKVEAYVTANNVNVPNYDTLVADVNAKDAAAAAAIGAVSGTTFNCDSQESNAVGKFQTGVVRDELNALKAYRTSIKSLIAAVKTAVSTGSVSNQGGSAQ